MAVAILAMVKEVHDIKEGEKEIIGILERDKKAQLIVDYEILMDYLSNIIQWLINQWKFYGTKKSSV